MNFPKANLKWGLIGLVVVMVGVLTASHYLAEPFTPAPLSPVPSPVTLAPQDSSPTQPKIAWSEKQIEMVLSRGESATKTLTFTSTQGLQNVVIEAVPKIAPFFPIQPPTFANVPANQPQPVQISFLIPATATLGDYNGTIHVRSGNQTLAQTVKVLLHVWLGFHNVVLGFGINYPPTWSVRSSEPGSVMFSPLSADPLQESPHISVETISNPDNKDIFNFYTGPYQRDLLAQSDGVFSTGSIDGLPYYEFSPTQTFAGERIIIIPLTGRFLEFIDCGAAFQGPSGVFDQMLSEERKGKRGKGSNLSMFEIRKRPG